MGSFSGVKQIFQQLYQSEEENKIEECEIHGGYESDQGGQPKHCYLVIYQGSCVVALPRTGYFIPLVGKHHSKLECDYYINTR